MAIFDDSSLLKFSNTSFHGGRWLVMSIPAKKRKASEESDHPDSGRGTKRANTRSQTARSPRRTQCIDIWLSDKTRQLAGLLNPTLVFIPDGSYLESIADDCGYLYDLVSRICEVRVSSIKLFVQNDGELKGEGDTGWEHVSQRRVLIGGSYLCTIDAGITFITHRLRNLSGRTTCRGGPYIDSLGRRWPVYVPVVVRSVVTSEIYVNIAHENQCNYHSHNSKYPSRAIDVQSDSRNGFNDGRHCKVNDKQNECEGF
jgi:hypothetical protein